MATIIVNGRRIELPEGASGVTITAGGEVRVGGALVASGLSGVVEVRWEGPLARLHCEAAVTVNGDVGQHVYAAGSVVCRNVGGYVDAGGSVSCGDVAGDVDAGGSVQCGAVGGSVDAGGSIHHSR